MDDLTTIRACALDYLKAHGMSVMDFASITGIDVRRCYQVFNGGIWPSLKQFVEVAEAMGVSVDWLVGLEPKPTPIVGTVGDKHYRREVTPK